MAALLLLGLLLAGFGLALWQRHLGLAGSVLLFAGAALRIQTDAPWARRVGLLAVIIGAALAIVQVPLRRRARRRRAEIERERETIEQVFR